MRFNIIFISILVLAFAVMPGAAQEKPKAAVPAPSATPTPASTPALSENENKGIALAESVILVYSSLRGAQGLDRIGKTTVEYGTIEYVDALGKANVSKYERRAIRGESIDDAKIRLDQRFPDAQYALIYDGKKIFGVFNDTVFPPTSDAIASFSDRYWHGLSALMRYRSNKSKVVFDREEKIMGVEFAVIKVTDSSDRSTEFFVSKKSFRVMMLEYETRGKKYRRKFYDYNYAQNVLVPYRTVLWADNKKVEEQKTATITFGQELGDGLFDVS